MKEPILHRGDSGDRTYRVGARQEGKWENQAKATQTGREAQT